MYLGRRVFANGTDNYEGGVRKSAFGDGSVCGTPEVLSVRHFALDDFAGEIDLLLVNVFCVDTKNDSGGHLGLSPLIDFIELSFELADT